MKRTLVALFAPALLLAGPLAAADGRQPGLWEIHNTTLVDGKPLPTLNDIMKDVPPQMREQMKGMMAKDGVGYSNDGAIQVCVSAASATRKDMPTADHDPNCQVKTTDQGKGHWTFHMECQNPPRQGDGETTLVNDKLWKNHMRMTQMDHGKTQVVEIQGEGRWLGSDCGGLKPQR